MYVITKVSMRSVFVLRLGDCLNILIVFGRCALTFDWLIRTGNMVIIQAYFRKLRAECKSTEMIIYHLISVGDDSITDGTRWFKYDRD
jgi:hypothetical protein